MNSRVLAVLIAAGIFGAGAAAGIAADRLIAGGAHDSDRGHHGPPRGSDDLAARYRERIGLDEAQAAAVAEILRARFGECDAIREKGNADIRAALRPDQLPRFDEIVREQEQRRARRRSAR